MPAHHCPPVEPRLRGWSVYAELLDPAALLDRLAASLDALGTGAVDLPERQRTLRAAVEWSIGLLEGDERSLLEAAAVFVDGWTIPAASQVAGLEEALELSVAAHSTSAVTLCLAAHAQLAFADGDPDRGQAALLTGAAGRCSKGTTLPG